jgi:putative endonuclease
MLKNSSCYDFDFAVLSCASIFGHRLLRTLERWQSDQYYFVLLIYVMYYAYILLSQKDLRYYFGHTGNLQQRLSQHNNGAVKSTRYRRPFILHYFEPFETKADANRRELFFKSFEGRKWLIENHIVIPR